MARAGSVARALFVAQRRNSSQMPRKHNHVDKCLALAMEEVERKHEWAQAQGSRENKNAKAERKRGGLLNEKLANGQSNAPDWLYDLRDMKENKGTPSCGF